jgi:hypothetical protein
MKIFEVLIQYNFKETYCNKQTEIKAKSINEVFENLKGIPKHNWIMKHNPLYFKKGYYAIDRSTNLIIRQK